MHQACTPYYVQVLYVYRYLYTRARHSCTGGLTGPPLKGMLRV